MDATSRRIKEMEVMVADVIIETPDTTTLVLFTGNDRLEYLAGHFLTIDPHQFESLERFTSFLEDLKGKREPPRAYSMSSAPHARYLAVTVKEERYASGSSAAAAYADAGRGRECLRPDRAQGPVERGAAARRHSKPERMPRLRLRPRHLEIRSCRRETGGHGAAGALPRIGARGPQGAGR